jgi:hypothetical protein
MAAGPVQHRDRAVWMWMKSDRWAIASASHTAHSTHASLALAGFLFLSQTHSTAPTETPQRHTARSQVLLSKLDLPCLSPPHAVPLVGSWRPLRRDGEESARANRMQATHNDCAACTSRVMGCRTSARQAGMLQVLRFRLQLRAAHAARRQAHCADATRNARNGQQCGQSVASQKPSASPVHQAPSAPTCDPNRAICRLRARQQAVRHAALRPRAREAAAHLRAAGCTPTMPNRPSSSKRPTTTCGAWLGGGWEGETQTRGTLCDVSCSIGRGPSQTNPQTRRGAPAVSGVCGISVSHQVSVPAVARTSMAVPLAGCRLRRPCLCFSRRPFMCPHLHHDQPDDDPLQPRVVVVVLFTRSISMPGHT